MVRGKGKGESENNNNNNNNSIPITCHIQTKNVMAVKFIVAIICVGLAFGQETRKQPIVLEEANFEHLTQASTGATTGDWLVLLYVL